MTEDQLIDFIAGLPGVAAVKASEAIGAPEVAWGDSFFFYDPEGDQPADRRDTTGSTWHPTSTGAASTV